MKKVLDLQKKKVRDSGENKGYHWASGLSIKCSAK